MKNYILLLLLIASYLPVRAQTEVDTSLPEFGFEKRELAGHMYFLASDYLRGRRTGSIGNEIAAEYIASQLKAYGYAPIDAENESYFQEVPLKNIKSPDLGVLTVGDNTYDLSGELMIMRGPAAEVNGEVVYANFGWVDPETDHNDYANLDVAGKIVITRMGIPGDQGQSGVFNSLSKKAEMAAEAGAAGLIELYTMPFPFSSFKSYLGGSRIGMVKGEGAPIPYGFVNAGEVLLPMLRDSKGTIKGSLTSGGMDVTPLDTRNVGGILRGSDPELADEYLMLTAHFDHMGVGKQGGGAYTEQDSIFNGARDNAFGTTSLLAAARAFADNPPRRSIIVLAVTGEEMGLLGSAYYADNPIIPLEQTVYNFNTDGAGYNDTTAISLFGANRTGIDPQVEAAAAAFNTKVIGDPAPEQGLYDRSDNVSFAKKGVPALTFSPGFADFDDAIFKYYHQVTDNPETIDLDYLKKYCQIFTLAARLIADRDVRPFWEEGDKYEAAGKELYNKK